MGSSIMLLLLLEEERSSLARLAISDSVRSAGVRSYESDSERDWECNFTSEDDGMNVWMDGLEGEKL